MTAAWYGHLRFKNAPMWKTVLVSWAIAFFEYCLQVPANRWAYGRYTGAQLKVAQEFITLVVLTLRPRKGRPGEKRERAPRSGSA